MSTGLAGQAKTAGEQAQPKIHQTSHKI